MKNLGFSGVVGGVAYTDPALFEQAAHDLGHRGVSGARVPKWKIGTPVSIRYGNALRYFGQVWSKAAVDNYVWVAALDNGKYVVVNMQSGNAYEQQPRTVREKVDGRYFRDVLKPDPVGKVAA